MTPAISTPVAGASAAAASTPLSSAQLAAAAPPDRYGLFPIERLIAQLYTERATCVAGCEDR
jgi:hypothetical protein